MSVDGFAFESNFNVPIIAGDTSGGTSVAPEPSQVGNSLVLIAGLVGYLAARNRLKLNYGFKRLEEAPLLKQIFLGLAQFGRGFERAFLFSSWASPFKNKQVIGGEVHKK